MGAAPAKPVVSDLEKCQRALILRSGKLALAKAGQPWKNLPNVLSHVQAGTLLVNINLGYGTPTMAYLRTLTEPTADLKIPEDLNPHHKDNVAFVANGDRKALLGLYDRIAASPAFETTRFEVWDFTSTQIPIAAPQHVIQFNERTSAQERKEIERQITQRLKNPGGFSVYNFSEDQTVFFLPRASLQDGSNGDFFDQQKIKTTWNRAVPKLWTNWLSLKSDLFAKPTVVFNRNWAILSASAFKKIYELHRLDDHRLPDIGDIDENVRQALKRCFGISCEVTPVQLHEAAAEIAANETPAAAELSKWARTRIIQFFKAHRGPIRLSDPNGLRSIFIHLAELVSDSKAKDQYIKAIRSIQFSPTDYGVIAYTQPSEPALARLADGWRAFLRANRSEYADQPLTTQNVKQAIRNLPR